MRKDLFRKCMAMGIAAVMTTAMLATVASADDEIVVGGIFNVMNHFIGHDFSLLFFSLFKR